MTAHRATRRDLPLADVSAALATRLAVAGPSPEFADRLRTRLLAVAAVAPQGAAADGAERAAPVSRALARPAWLPRLVVGGAAGVIAVVGVGVATSRALPGEPLYAAKQQVESWQLALHHGDASRGREELAFARTRLAEVTALSRHHDLTSAGAGGTTDDRIASTLHTMDAETRSGADDLVTAAGHGDQHAAADLLAFATTQSAQLAAVVPDLPGSTAPAVASSRALLAVVRTQAAALPGVAARGTAPAPGSPTTPASSPTPSTPASAPASASTSAPASPSPTATDPSVSQPPDPAASPTLTPTESPTDAPSDLPGPSDTPTPSASAPDSDGTTPSDTPTPSPSDTPSTAPTATPTATPTAPSSGPPTVSVPPVSVGPVVVGPIVITPPPLLSPTVWFARPFGPDLFVRLIAEVRLVLSRLTP